MFARFFSPDREEQRRYIHTSVTRLQLLLLPPDNPRTRALPITAHVREEAITNSGTVGVIYWMSYVTHKCPHNPPSSVFGWSLQPMERQWTQLNDWYRD